MKSFTNGNTLFRYVKVPTQSGERIKKATGTSDPVTGDQIADMVSTMVEKHAWDVLTLITKQGDEALSLQKVFGIWRMTPSTKTNARTGASMAPGDDERLEYVRTTLKDVDLDPLVDEFKRVLLGSSKKIGAATAKNYVAQVRMLIPAGHRYLSSALTTAALIDWIEDMDDVSSNTVIRRSRGMARFTKWLKSKGVLAIDPIKHDDFELPSAYDAQPHYIDAHEAELLAETQEGDFRHFSAILSGTGIEFTPLFGSVRRRDVDLDSWTIRAAGTKNYNRDRIVKIATWARPHVKAIVAGKHPDAKLFDFSSPWMVQQAHKAATDTLFDKGYRVFKFLDNTPKQYRMRDQRHTWAVYAIRGGWPIEAVARQLGHINGILCHRVYGRFVPSLSELNMYEELADLAAKRRHEATKQIALVAG